MRSPSPGWEAPVSRAARAAAPPGFTLGGTAFIAAEAAFVCDRPSAEVIGYSDQCARSDAVLTVTPLSAPTRGRIDGQTGLGRR